MQLVGRMGGEGGLAGGWLACRIAWLEGLRQLCLVWAKAPLRPPPTNKPPSSAALLGQVSSLPADGK